MNEEVKSASPEGLEGVPGAVGLPASIERPEPIWLPEKPEDLPGRDLRKANLKDCPWLLPEHLAGSDLTGNRTLPDDIAKFPALDQVATISSEARKIFVGLLAACVYSWLVIGTTTDLALILNTASSPLPIINTPIPIAGFYWVGAGLLAGIYIYLHLYLRRLWRILATLPAIFPDATPLDDKSDPWLLTNLVGTFRGRSSDKRERRRSDAFMRLETGLVITLAWAVVPFTLFGFWASYLPRHDWRGTCLLVGITSFTTVFGWHFFRFTRLRGKALALNEPGLRGTWRELRTPGWAGRFFWFLAVILTPIILAVGSYAAFHVDPHDDRSWAAAGLNGLRFVGIRTYANLREEEVAQRPEDWTKDWTGNDWANVKRLDLRGQNLAFADATGAFLANADLRGANLTGAILVDAQLQWTILDNSDGNRGSAQLEGANLRGAQLQHAQLAGANLQGANLGDNADLQGADLMGAQLRGANLTGALGGMQLVFSEGPPVKTGGAQLQGAFLGGADLQGACLSGANLQGAHLTEADLSGADLRGAGLQGADLRAARLQGADMRRANIWGADVDRAEWELADLRYSSAQPMSFPEEWRSEPNVMFEPVDPETEPFDWGPPKWATEQEYDVELAKFLADLACSRDIPEAQTRGLAWRALDSNNKDRLFAQRLAAKLIGADCPPGKGLPDYIRRGLEQLASPGDEATPSPEASPPDPVE